MAGIRLSARQLVEQSVSELAITVVFECPFFVERRFEMNESAPGSGLDDGTAGCGVFEGHESAVGAETHVTKQ